MDVKYGPWLCELKCVGQQNFDGGVWPNNWANKEAWLLDNPHTSKHCRMKMNFLFQHISSVTYIKHKTLKYIISYDTRHRGQLQSKCCNYSPDVNSMSNTNVYQGKSILQYIRCNSQYAFENRNVISNAETFQTMHKILQKAVLHDQTLHLIQRNSTEHDCWAGSITAL